MKSGSEKLDQIINISGIYCSSAMWSGDIESYALGEEAAEPGGRGAYMQTLYFVPRGDSR